MASEIEPPELARLVELAERPRTADWSLRAALTRYAQGQPERVRDLLEQVRRIEGVLRSQASALSADGPALWRALSDGESPGADHAVLVGVLGAADDIDRVADRLAAWADDRRAVERPDAEVDEVTASVGARLDRLGVPREVREAGPRGARSPRSRG